ncbi:MAG TPA: hypothetical protein VHL78_05555 [Actinomycetota bacterium]|nr:hypothetical protein [Actinomycetota bacterium]
MTGRVALGPCATVRTYKQKDARTVRTRSEQLRLPRFIARGGPVGWLSAAGAGVVLAGVTLVIPSLLSDRAAFGFLAILLGMIAAVYLGFALQDGRRRAFVVEYGGMVLFAGAATVALVVQGGIVLALGYFGHGLWDAIHHRRGLDTVMPWWYVPLCLGYDALIGAYVLLRLA